MRLETVRTSSYVSASAAYTALNDNDDNDPESNRRPSLPTAATLQLSARQARLILLDTVRLVMFLRWQRALL
jgi:hypothetical protein